METGATRADGAPPGRPRRIGRGRAIGIVIVLALLGGPTGWIVTDELEARNDFCNACHLEEDLPLHRDVRRDFDGRPAPSLAALHATTPVAARPEASDFRCIDCHGGAGFTGKLRVKVLAAKDALVWLSGDFEEPDGMNWPLLDADCRKCHPSFAEKGDGAGGTAFHDLSVHNVELGVDCVECHSSHDAGGDPDAWFLRGAAVRLRCADCHDEFVVAPLPGWTLAASATWEEEE